MLKKYIGISLISASIAVAGCSSSDDDDGPVTIPEAEAPGEEAPGEEAPGEEAPGEETATTIVVPQEFTPADGVTLNLAETLTNGIGGNTFATLVGAAGTAGLTDALTGPGILTVFAPTDAAFDALGAANIPAETAALADLLQLHIVSGALDANAIAASVGLNAEALNGGTLPVTQDGEALLISGAGLVVTDVQATNGIVHVIDTVLGVTAPPAEEEPAEVDPTAPIVTEASLIALNEAGFTEYVTLHTNASLGAVFDENEWTAFIPTNAALPDDADQSMAFIIVNDHLLTNGAFTAGELLANNPPTANGGAALTFGGTADALTVNGFTATPIVIEGLTANLFAIDGVITP